MSAHETNERNSRPTSEPRGGLLIPSAEEQNKKEYSQSKRKKQARDTAQFAFSAVLTISTVTTALFMSYQSCTMREQTDAVVKSAKAASDANILAEESIRGRIAIKNARFQKPITVGEKIVVLLETENLGHAAAFERVGQDVEHWRELPLGPNPITIPEGSTTREPGDRGTFIITDKISADRDFLRTISSNINRTKNDPPTAYFLARILYKTLGKEHHTDFCAFVVRYNTAFIPITPASSSLTTDPNFVLRECPKWHDAD